MLGQIAAVVEEARHQEIARVAVAHDDAGAELRRNDVGRVAPLLLLNRCILPRFSVRLFWKRKCCEEALLLVRVVLGSATRRAIRRIVFGSTPATGSADPG